RRDAAGCHVRNRRDGQTCVSLESLNLRKEKRAGVGRWVSGNQWDQRAGRSADLRSGQSSRGHRRLNINLRQSLVLEELNIDRVNVFLQVETPQLRTVLVRVVERSAQIHRRQIKRRLIGRRQLRGPLRRRRIFEHELLQT